MITKLTLSDFRPHGRLDVTPGPGVTVFVGPTDAGKSSVLLALRWLLLNVPNGDGLTKWGSDRVKVAAVVDGVRVARARKPGRNVYVLDGKEYKFDQARRGGVPDDVAALFQVCDDNFQLQHDAPFWLSLPPGQVAKALNTVVDLEEIDVTLAGVNAEVRRATAEVEVSKKRLEQAEREAAELDHVPVLLERWDRVLAAERAYREVQQKRALLAKLVGEATRTREQAAEARRGAKQGASLLEVGDEVVLLSQARRRLAKLIQEAKAHRAARVEVSDIMPLVHLRADLDQQAEKRRRLEILVEKAQRLEEESWDAKSSYQSLAAELSKLGRCPTCGGGQKTPSQPRSSVATFTSGTSPRPPGRRGGTPGTG